MTYQIVNFHVDTLMLNIKGTLPGELAARLDELQGLAKEAEADVSTAWQFQGMTLFLKPHGSKHSRWILTCADSYLHLELSKGKLNGIICQVRFSSLLLHEKSTAESLNAVYAFLVGLLGGEGFTLQVSEVHLCADIAGWELHLADAERFVSQGRARTLRMEEAEQMMPITRMSGRHCNEFKFSTGAPHSCDIYDKTLEVKTHQKQWFYEVWKQNGWDGASKVIRVEFRYKRECLHEMGIECPYDMLGEFDRMWAYSTQKWLRHTCPDGDSNQSRWAVSDVWQVVQAASGDDSALPLARTKKVELDTERSKAGFVGYATSWAIRAVWLYEAQHEGHPVASQAPGLPIEAVDEDGGGFLAWAYDQMQGYLKDRKELSFAELMQAKGDKIIKLLQKAA
jgi:hypothetical protein